MQESQEMSNESQEVLSNDVNQSLGIDSSVVSDNQSPDHDELPDVAKKRLGIQEKRHKKEMRKMQQQIEEMRSHLSSRSEPQDTSNDNGHYDSSNHGGMDDQIYKAISRAMELQKMQEHKSKEHEKAKHMHKQYQALQERLDNASSKYEDFDDVVRSEDAPYSDAIRDAALLVDNADDVLYRLGKDRDNLKRLSQLHPIEQMKEFVRMSVALRDGNDGKSNSSSSNARPLGQVKNNPVRSHGINENSSPAEIRAKMKQGGKNWSK